MTDTETVVMDPVTRRMMPRADYVALAKRRRELRPRAMAQRFAKVPLSDFENFAPRERVLLGLRFMEGVTSESAEADGWYRLDNRRCGLFLIADKHQRKRAIRSLEEEGMIEVRRERGRRVAIRTAQKDRGVQGKD